MFIRHNRRVKPGLSASLLTRDQACAMYPPGSDAWARWNCGPAPTPAPTPAPPPAQMYTPAPPPVQYAVPPPKTVAPPPANIDYDAEYARRVQIANDENIASQLRADEQARIAADEAAKADAAKRELDAMKASAAMSMSALDAGGAEYGFDNAGKTSAPASSESSNGLIIAALAAFGIYALSKRKGR